ncbi:hypothetical protein [Sphingomonas sp. MMS24-J13]|uniref:Pam3-gp28 family putative phage holin n=1 Tax=Sphingomonas sp. MMS24-J13 TaxID=3238686 RepID=UPI00384CDFE0
MSDIPAPAETAARALLASATRHALIIVGTWLISHGALDAKVVDDATGPIVDAIVGTIMVGGAMAWDQIRAAIAHRRFARPWSAWAALNAPAPAQEPRAPYHQPSTMLLGAGPLSPLPTLRPTALGPEPDLQTENIPMSSIIVKIEHDVLDFLHAAGKAVETVVLTEVQAAVAAAKQTPLGTLAQSLIQIFDSHRT